MGRKTRPDEFVADKDWPGGWRRLKASRRAEVQSQNPHPSKNEKRGTRLGRDFAGGEVIHGGDAEGVGYSIEEGEHGGDVDGFGDLIFGPAGVAQLLDVGSGGAGGGLGDQFHVVEQDALGERQAGFVELAFENRGNALIGGSLDTQEVGVAVESIGAAIEVGDVAGDHLLVAAGEVAFGEMNFI
jgi:hypothetical protein